MNLETLLGIVLVSPLVGSLAARITPQKHALQKFSGIVAALAIAISLAATIPLARNAFDGTITVVSLGDWISIGSLQITLSVAMTKVAAFMTLIITGVGLLIHVFSLGYMAHEVRQNRFFSYLNLFVFFMLVLVLGSSLPITFIGWEGVGLCSYLLISFWFENDDFAKAGKKAFIVNRIGDVGFLLAIFLLLAHGQSLEVSQYQSAITGPAMPAIWGFQFWEVIAFCLLLGAVGKSAQIPLFIWLPDAMAGPTPVSALIHAATMVTAGVFLIVQYGAIFALAPDVLQLMGWLAALTSLYGALIALTKNDIKKVLAYSTVSQLGLMFLGLASGTESGALFHVLTHAFFKACLFLGAGAVIYGCHHEQDIRKMGGLLKLMPVTAVTFLAAALAGAGVPPFGPFFSKGMIVEAAGVNPAWFAIAEVVSVCTAAYMTRLFCTVFLGEYRGEEKPHEVSFIFTLPLMVLALGSVSIGLILHGGEHLAGLLHIRQGAVEPLELVRDFLHAWPAFAGITVGFFFWKAKPLSHDVVAVVDTVSAPLEKNLYVDELYDLIIVRPLHALAMFAATVVEYAVDALSTVVPEGLSFGTKGLQVIQNGQIRLYGLLLLIGSGIILVFIG